MQQQPPFLAAAAIKLGNGKARAFGSDSDNRAPTSTCSDDTAAPPFFTIKLKSSLCLSSSPLFSYGGSAVSSSSAPSSSLFSFFLSFSSHVFPTFLPIFSFHFFCYE
ncbi:uncharacterized protein DS421_16g555040 [Arachis hypogaea]|nr:uncharacterized protein DS421_16g555040 [Arachis hypogaea]